MDMKNMTPQQRREYLTQKYVKRDYNIEDLKPQYALFWRPDSQDAQTWILVCVCDTEEQCLQEILWRKKYHETNDGDLVLDNDDRFKTFRDETTNIDVYGRTKEPGNDMMEINYNGSKNMLETIANSPAATNSQTGFKGLAHYTNLSTEYEGYYKIDKVYYV